MTTHTTEQLTQERSLRLWPGLMIVALQWTVRWLVPLAFPDALAVGVLAGLLGGLGVIAWWLFWSRVPWFERLAGVGLIAVTLAVARLFLHPSVRDSMLGLMFPVYAVPVVSLAFVSWAAISERLSPLPRWMALAVLLFVSGGMWTLVRTAGMTGSADNDFAWRWSPTPEDRLLAQTPNTLAGSANATPPTEILAEADWPGFRGLDRNGVVRGTNIASDWNDAPPVELWRQPIGPGWSSFAVGGGMLYTQEQRGEAEVVSAYDLETGEPVWQHQDPERFWEATGGPGPRSTPTLASGRIYSFGANGILNALAAGNGHLLWTRNAANDHDAKVPYYGFSSSPLVLEGQVVISVAGQLVAYDATTGALRWSGPPGNASYSSPQRVVLSGVTQVLQATTEGLTSVLPATGEHLWQYDWPGGVRIVQPALLSDGNLLLSEGEGRGLRRLDVTRNSADWTLDERWTSTRLKPYHNDFVIHRDSAFGFDGSILAAVDLDSGERQWKGGRYGHGQLLLLVDQDLLLVIGERGDLALVEASPTGFRERAKAPALTGKTWNHPVLVGDLLLVRNGEEMAALRLATTG